MNVQNGPGDDAVTAVQAKLTRGAMPPLLGLVPTPKLGLTVEKLIETRWRLGVSGRGELTSSFYFGADGRVKVFKSFNEAAWQLKDGVLELCDVQGVVAWRFDLAFQVGGGAEAEQLLLVSGFRKPTTEAGVTLYLLEHRPDKVIAAAPVAEEGAVADPAAGPEAVRLVIWDLDDTFWQGTLSEGAVIHNARNAAIVEALNRRGIVSAICSKNNHEPVEATLRAQGLWDKFVFPRIAFAPKGAMVAQIIKDAQLRAPTVLFIDDNVTNLNEALYYSPGLQIAEPDFLEHLLDDPRFKGKPDPELNRLARYRVLERKLADQAASAGAGTDNAQFLRESKIRISIHANIEDEFARIHDLVNRTNQLNFTKNRWPEDLEEARRQFEKELEASFVSECGVVKVADRYGSYGICGFYLVSNGTCTHFLFSCRSMNMGVEQFVWAKLGRPFVPVKGEVISDIDAPVDWIRVVDDAEAAEAGDEKNSIATVSVGMFGACNLAMAASYLRQWFQVSEELNYPYHDWGIFPLPRIIASAAEARTPANQAVLARLPGMPPTRYESFLLDGTPDAFIISFCSESFCGYYRVRGTGLVIPLINGRIGKRDFRELSFEEIQEKGVAGVSQEQWRFMQQELEFIGAFNPARFASDARRTLEIAKAHGKPVIVIGLNETVGRDKPILDLFGRINRIVNPMAAEFGFPVIDVADFIEDEKDIADDMGGAHYRRQVYAAIATEIRRLLDGTLAASAAIGAGVSAGPVAA